MRPSCLLVFAACAWVRAQQGPGMGYPLQLFHLSPSAAALLPHNQGRGPQAERVTTRLPGAGANSAGHRRGVPINPGAHRMLTPAAVSHAARGAGEMGFQMPYWKAGTGFQAGRDELLGLPLPPRDTPEVQAARDAHLQQVQAALLLHADAHDRLQQQQQRPAPGLPPHHFAPPAHDPVLSEVNGVVDGDSLVVESDGHLEPPVSDESELTRYPDLQQVPQALYDPSHVHDPDLEAVIVDAVTSNGRSRGRARARSLAKPESTEEKNIETPVRGEIKSVSNVNSQHTLWPNVPMYIEVKPIQDEPEAKSQIHVTENESPSYSQKAVFANANLPSAVHSFQVPPSQRMQFIVPQLPLFLTPHDTLPLSYSAKANYFHSIPVAAVHDAQMHPSQVGAVSDHQQQPVFHETPVEVSI